MFNLDLFGYLYLNYRKLMSMSIDPIVGEVNRYDRVKFI